MLRSSLLFCVLLLPMAARAQAPQTASRAVSAPYAHALRVEAQREAFWRTHGHTVKTTEMPDVSLRKAQYWSAQSHGRALCQAYGNCF